MHEPTPDSTNILTYGLTLPQIAHCIRGRLPISRESHSLLSLLQAKSHAELELVILLHSFFELFGGLPSQAGLAVCT